jgi:hypothetical protein
MLRKRLSIVALTVATVTAITLTTAQPAQAERNEDMCRMASEIFWRVSHMYTWHYTFYGPNHPDTIWWGDRFMGMLETTVGSC